MVQGEPFRGGFGKGGRMMSALADDRLATNELSW